MTTDQNRPFGPIERINFVNENISFSLIDNLPLLAGDIRLLRTNGSKLTLKKRGDFLEQSEWNKWEKLRDKIELQNSLNWKWCESFLDLFKKYFLLHSSDSFCHPKRIQDWGVEFSYWSFLNKDREDANVMDLCYSMGAILFHLDDEDKIIFDNIPMELKRRNIVLSSLVTFIAINLGYRNWDFLLEIYNGLLFVDANYAGKTWSQNEKRRLLEDWHSGLDEKLYPYEPTKTKELTLIKEKAKNPGIFFIWESRFKKMSKDISSSGLSDFERACLLVNLSLKINKVSWDMTFKDLWSTVVFEPFKRSGDRVSKLLANNFKEAQGKNSKFLSIEGL